jgi:hypothetical protein
MQAYNKSWLKNLVIQKEASDAFEMECISKEEQGNINLAYPVGFYTPNFFIRIGLFALTVIIMLFSF